MNQLETKLLYMRLGLTPSATLMLITHYESIRGGTPPTIRSCRMFVKGEITPKNNFNQFLKFLDDCINDYVSQIIKNHKSNMMSLIVFQNSVELWQEHSSMFGCPIEVYFTLINRVILIAKQRGILAKLIVNNDNEIHDSDWSSTYNLSLDINQLIYQAIN